VSRTIALLGVTWLLAAGPALALERVPAVLHVHTDLSTGDFTLEELARTAERQGVEALLLAENYLLRIEYGLPPFRALTRVTREEPSVLAVGIDRYLERVAAVRRGHPRLVIIPGVEVMPHYFWSGSPLALSLALHNTQKNLLVFGLTDPEALASLPAVGNRGAGRYDWQSLVDAAPGLLVLPGAVLLLRKRSRRRRFGRAVVLIRRRSWFGGMVLAAVGVTALVRAWPFTVDRYPPWRDYGLAPHQALIDHVDRLGGATVWSFPEAPDSGLGRVGPVQVSWRTDPSVDDLLRTFRYTAFGALYDQPTRATEPGGLWDRLLGEYVSGERSRPAWAVGEAGFHGLMAGKRLPTVQTVFLAAERSEAGILEALRRGRFYAMRRTPEAALVLAEFAVAAGVAAAGPGETLRVRPGTPLQVRVAVEATGEPAPPLRVALIRNGTVAAVWAAPPPLRVVHRETFAGAPVVLRLEARGREPHHLIVNPIFVTAAP